MRGLVVIKSRDDSKLALVGTHRHLSMWKTAQLSINKEKYMWSKPEAIDIRAGFEVTMYFSIR